MRRILKNITLTVMIIAAFMMNVSCPQNGTSFNSFFSVGRTVDDVNPTVEITSHKNGDYMAKGDVTLSGTYKDNIGVTRVHVVLNSQTSSDYVAKEVQYDEKQSGSWSITFTEVEMNRLNIFAEQGTKVTFLITAYDALQNSGVTSVFMYVDMDPPKVEWQQPEKSTRFAQTDKDEYDSDKDAFNRKYSMSDPATLPYYHNGKFQISGFSSDLFGIRSTYLKFYAASDTLVAVTPVILTENGETITGHAAETTDKTLPVPEIGEVMEGATPRAWKFMLDSEALTSSTEWFRIEIITEDEAGHTTTYKDPKPWLLICQEADIPQNAFNISSSDDNIATISYGGLLSGYSFDDDGVSKVIVAVVPKDDTAAIDELTSVPANQWAKVSTDKKLVTVMEAQDQTVGTSVLNWSVKMALDGGDYKVFAVPYDINSVTRDDFYASQYKNVYYTDVRVASEKDPVITIDGTFRGTTIVKDGTDITGSFYDDKGVTKIEAKMSVTAHDDTTSDSEWITIYTNSNETGFGTGYITKVKEEPQTLSSGQTVTKYSFRFPFDPILFAKDYHYKSFKLLFKVYDNDTNHGNDEITVYGDSELPQFGSIYVDGEPADNPMILKDTTFDGWMSDNVGVAKMTISSQLVGFETLRFKLNPTSEEQSDGWLELETNGTTDKGYDRVTFSVVITPAMIMYDAPELVFTVTDENGLENKKSVFIKADTIAPRLVVESPANNTVLLGDVTFDGYADDNFEVVSVEVRTDNDALTVCDLSLDAESVEVDGRFRKRFSVLIKDFDGKKDTAVTFIARDNSNNEKEQSVNIIADTVLPQFVKTAFVPSSASIELTTDTNFTGIIEDNIGISLTDGLIVAGFDTKGVDLFAAKQINLTQEPDSNGKKRYSYTQDISPETDTKNKAAEIVFTVTDLCGNKNTYSYYVKDDSEPPTITVISPKNNIEMTGNTDFTGYVSDNIDVTELTIKNVTTGEPLATYTASSGLGSKDTSSDGKYIRSFTYTLTQDKTNYADAEILLTAVDGSFNTTTKSIFLKGDSSKPKIGFSGITAGAYARTGASFTVDVSHDRTDINTIVVSVNGVVQSYNLSSFEKVGGSKKHYSKTFTLGTGSGQLNLTDGDNTITVSAERVGGYVGESSLYFVVDNTAPTAMEITVPSLLSQGDMSALPNTVNEIQMEQITYYLNNEVTFKGIGTDNYKITDTTIDIYRASDNAQMYTIAIGLDGYSAKAGGVDWVGVTAVSGVPSNYSVKIDTTKMADETIYYLAVRSRDAAGNEGSAFGKTGVSYFRVMQAADKPRITFNAENGETVIPPYKFTGTAFDDDGFSSAKSFKIAFNKYANEAAAVDALADSNKIEVKNANTFSFSITTEDSEGHWWLAIQPIDKHGFPGDVQTIWVNASKSNNPIVETLSDEVGDTGVKYQDIYKGKVKINTTAYSGKDDTNVSKIYYRMYSSSCPSNSEVNQYSALASGTGLGGWYYNEFNSACRETDSITFDTSAFVAGSGNITLEVKVEAGGMTSQVERRTIIVDNEKPTVNISLPAGGATIDGMTTFSGTLRESGSSIKNVYISYHQKATWSESELNALTVTSFSDAVANGSNPAANKWYDLGTFATSWSYEYNSTVLDDESNRTIVVAAVDQLNNVGYNIIPVYVSQDNDRPIVTVTNMSLAGKTPDNYAVNTQGSIICSVSDDDGVVDYVWVSLDGNSWGSPVASKSTMFTYTSLSDGPQTVFIKVRDNKGTEFISKAAPATEADAIQAIKLKDSDATPNEFGAKGAASPANNTVIYAKMDTNNPVIASDVTYSTAENSGYDTIDNISNTVFGTVNSSLYVKFAASDANDITKAEWKLGNGDVWNDITTTLTAGYYKATVDVGGLTSDTYQLTLRVTDGVGKTTTKNYSVKVDTSLPTITINSPANDAIVDKTISVSGEVTGVGPTGIKQIYISYLSSLTADAVNNITSESQITPVTTTVDTVDKWTKIGNNASWSYQSYNTTLITAGVDGQIKNNYILAVAAVCNNGYVTKSYKTINIDQDNDRPIITISNMDLTEKKSSVTPIKNTQGEISGSVYDADGTVQYIGYSLSPLGATDAGWITASENSSTFTYSSQGDGSQTVYFKVTDAKGTSFISMISPSASAQFNAVKLRDSKSNQFGYKGSSDRLADTVVYAMMDTTPPEFGTIEYSLNGSAYNAISGLSSLILGGTVSPTLYIRFTALDANGIASAQYKLGTGSLSPTTGTGPYTAAIDLRGEESGRKTLTLYITDGAGRSASMDYEVMIDNTKPSITMTSPAGHATVDKMITVSGNASDASAGLKGLYISYITNLEAANLSSLTAANVTDNIAADTAGKWTQIPLNSSWNYTYDTEKITTSGKSGYILAVAAIDNNDNISTDYRQVNIDQDQDRPVVKLLTVRLGESMSSSSRSWITSTSITGMVTDLDGTVKSISVSKDGSVWEQISTNESTFTYSTDTPNIPLTDGPLDLHFKIVDYANGEFRSQAAVGNTNIKLIDSSNVQYGYKGSDATNSNTVVYATVDNQPPTITNVQYYDYDSSSYVSIDGIDSTTFGGSSRQELKIRFTATDTNGISVAAASKPRMWFYTSNGEYTERVATGSGLSANNSGTYDVTVDVSDVASGTKTFVIKVKDVASENGGSSGWTDSTTYSVVIDNTAPIIDFYSPSEGTVVYGSNTTNKVTGALSDVSGYASIMVDFTKDDTTPDFTALDITNEFGDNVDNWTMYFDGSGKAADAGSKEYYFDKYNDLKSGAIIDTGIDEAQPLYIWLEVTDKLGNISINKRQIGVLANADKPTIEIAYPVNGATVGGTVRINGTTNIMSGNVDSVWLWIDPDFDPTNDSDLSGSWTTELGTILDANPNTGAEVTSYSITSDNINGTPITGVKATGLSNWYLRINGEKELNRPKSRIVAIRAIAIGETGKTATSDLIYFTVDQSAPVFGETLPVKLVKSSENKEMIYADNTWIDDRTGKWVLTGSIEDADGILSLDLQQKINGVQVGSAIHLITDGAVTAQGKAYIDWNNPISGPFEDVESHKFASNWKFNIPISSTGDYGSVSYVLTAVENTGTGKDSEVEYIMRYDTMKPVWKSIDLSADETNMISNTLSSAEDQFYTIRGRVSETSNTSYQQSGTQRVALYFKRGGNVVDVMLSQGAGHDNEIPASALTEKFGLMCRTINNVTIDGSQLTLPSSTLTKNNNIRPGGLVIYSNVIYRIKSVSGDGVTDKVITDTTISTSEITGAEVYFPMCQVIDNVLNESEDYKKNFEVFDYTGNYPAPTFQGDDGDQMIESITDKSTSYDQDWKAVVNTKNIYDGTITVVAVAFDNAGNYAVKEFSNCSVMNNPPRIAGISFGCDMNDDGAYTGIGEMNTEFSGIFDKNGLHKRENLTFNGRSKGENKPISNFYIPGEDDKDAFPGGTAEITIKNDTEFRTEIVGGNTTLTYTVSVDGKTIKQGTLGSGSNEETVHFLPISITYEEWLKVAEDNGFANSSNKDVKIVITDATSNSATYWLKANFVLVDNTPPAMVIDNFYWSSKTDNSVYDTDGVSAAGSIIGHIDLSDDLPGDLFKVNNSGLWDKDAKVSGIIKIEGTVTDNVIVDKISATLGTISAGDVLTRKADGSWTEVHNIAAGYAAYIVDDYYDGAGWNIVKYRIYWDTSKITNVAATNQTISITAVDKGPATMSGGSLGYGVANSVSRTRKVDVVPYITGIKTNNRAASGLKDANIRSASGKYSILANNTSNTITVTGYNFSTSDFVARLVNTANSASTSITKTTGGTKLTANASSTTTATITNSGFTKSGYLEIFSSGIRSLNNINDNDAHDAAGSGSSIGSTIADYANYYNREADYYETKNVQLTDDRYLLMFEMHTAQTPSGTNAWKDLKNAYYPVMVMNGDNPVFGYMNGSGGPGVAPDTTAGTGAGTYQASHAMPQRAEFNGASGAEVYTEYLIKASAWDAMGMAVDEGGRYYNVSCYNRDGAAMSLIYDRYAELYTTQGLGWGAGTGYSNYPNGGNWSYSTGNNAITLDSMNYSTGVLLGRYMYPKLIANGNSKTGTAKVYMAYYDDGTGEIVFRNFQLGRTVSGTATALDSSHTDKGDTTYRQYVNFTENTGNTAYYTTGRLTAVAAGSKYYDMAVTSDNHVVIVYYDEDESKLKLIYSTNAVDGSSPTANVAWTTSSVSFPSYAGTYVSMTIDSSNGIHIAAFDASDADLKYFYLSGYSATSLTNLTIDATGSVGQWTGIAICTDSDNSELYGKPVITYYNSTETGTREPIKLAYPKASIGSITAGVDSNGYTVGGWEYMTVPTITPPQGGDSKFQKVCLGFDTKGRPVVGYCATNLEFGKQLDE